MGSFVNQLIGGNTSLAAASPTQQNLNPAIQQAQAGTESNIANQNAFAQALQTQAQGGGPNLAGSLLANATGQNVANQAALMASQRGTGSNAGLIARQAAQQGAGIQQNAAGQAAAERQQEELNAQQGLSTTYANIGNEQGQNLATNQAALTGQNTNLTNTNAINAKTGAGNATNSLSVLSGLGQSAAAYGGAGGGSSGLAAIAAASGGEVEQSSLTTPDNSTTFSEPLPDHLQSIADIYHPSESAHNGYNASTNQYAEGGKVNALVSPGEIIIPPSKVKAVAEGKAHPLKSGEKIPGKPKVPGAVNSYANDTIPKKLAVGSVVEPRSVTQSFDPVNKGRQFVQAVIEKNNKKKGAK